jgi:hypothetical protein
MGFNEFNSLPKKILVEVQSEMEQERLELITEASTATVGRFTARRDPPHFQGDEYHAHSKVPGGFEVAWGRSGVRRHPNKFPAEIPNDAKEAVAKVLGVSKELLETFRFFDDVVGEEVLLIEVRDV